MTEEHEGEKESWNMATATMKRLNNLLLMSSLYSQQRNFPKWFGVLMDLRRNLFPFLEKKEFDDVTEKLEQLPEYWGTSSKHNPLVNKTFDEVYMIFISCMKSKGLLMPKTQDTGKAVTQM